MITFENNVILIGKTDFYVPVKLYIVTRDILEVKNEKIQINVEYSVENMDEIN